jgi:4-amino-4-deoxy-L-arabinose transferase-like glycosyltransferase
MCWKSVMLYQSKLAERRMHLRRIAWGAGLLGVVGAAFALRLAYLLHSHPFMDEFTTILAAQAILQRGLPVLPSGLFYEHGLLFTYLDAPFVALAGEKSLFAVARVPSLLLGTAGVLLVYWVGRRWFSRRAGLIAAGLLALSPEGMVWGGRARMYALAQVWVLLLAFLVYEGSLGAGEGLAEQPARRGHARWLALLVLLAALLTQLGALMLVPPLLVGALVVGWLARPAKARPWFLTRAALGEAAALGVVVGLGLLVKRLGRPLGAESLAGGGPGQVVSELVGVVTYQAGLALDGESAIKFLARQFGVPHHLWLVLVACLGGVVALAMWLRSRRAAGQAAGSSQTSGGATHSPLPLRFRDAARTPYASLRGRFAKCVAPEVPNAPYALLYLWLVFGLTVLEMITLLDTWRRNPRYLVMAFPLFYLMVAAGLERILSLNRARRHAGRAGAPQVLALVVFVAVQARFLIPDLGIAYRTPEPAYEQAFQYVRDHWQAGDLLLTMNTSGAGLLLAQGTAASAGPYRFAMQEDADQFLLDTGNGWVDRWLGVPWIGTAGDFNRALNEHERVWFVIDTIRLPVYYRGDWLGILASQMDLAWSGDEALVYVSRAGRSPLPSQPDVATQARFGDMIALKGYTLSDGSAARASACSEAGELCAGAGETLHVTLFWQAQAAVDADYTVFLHLRDAEGETRAQRDAQPFDGLYPTSQWQAGETVIQPLDLELPADLPAGSYSLYLGLYRLDTMTRLPLENDTSGENALRLNQSLRIGNDS